MSSNHWIAAAAIAATWAVPASARLTAGAGRATVAVTPAMLPLDGFEKVLDPLQARVVVLADGSAKVAIAVVDQTSMTSETVAEMKTAIATAAGTRPDDVWICASHTFSAPHYFPGRGSADEQKRGRSYQAAVMDAVRRAAADAAGSLRPARLGVGSGSSDVSVNRNVPMADGWWLGANDAGPSDKTTGVIRIEDEARRPIAILLNYAVQSSVMDHAVGAGGRKGVTADLAGAAVAHVERQYGAGSVALFMIGAAGDQMPGYVARRNVYAADGTFATVDMGDAGYSLVALQGERLGTVAVRVAESIAPGASSARLQVVTASVSLDAQQRPADLGQIRPSRTYTYSLAGKVATPYWILRLGDVALVGVQAELSAATGAAIRRASPFAHTMVATMVNGAAKYMPDADGYAKNTYQAMNSGYGPGSAEVLASRIVAALKAIRSGRR